MVSLRRCDLPSGINEDDLLVIGNKPMRGHLGENGNGYGIIVNSHIPVLSV